jgi:hypothetical protein
MIIFNSTVSQRSIFIFRQAQFVKGTLMRFLSNWKFISVIDFGFHNTHWVLDSSLLNSGLLGDTLQFFIANFYGRLHCFPQNIVSCDPSLIFILIETVSYFLVIWSIRYSYRKYPALAQLERLKVCLLFAVAET